MGLPEGSLAIAVLIVVALPGFIYAGVRRWARGESAEDRDLGLAVARGAVFAVALTGVYLLAFGDFLFAGLASGKDADTIKIADARGVALAVLGFYVIAPVILAFLLNFGHIGWVRVARPRWLRVPRSKHGYTSTPSAWDHAVRKNQHTWVKVHRANGEWVGGWFTKGSFATTYPELHSIYVAQQWAMTEDGNFEKAIPNTGVHLTIRDEDVVIWTTPPHSNAPQEATS